MEDRIIERIRTEEFQERFWAKADKRNDGDACWEWNATKTPRGRGQINVGRQPDGSSHLEYAHRVSWVLAYGPIPDGLFVCHHCDNPACVNPNHLFLGTAADNARDAAVKGRVARGEGHPKAKFTRVQVLEVRARLAAGEKSRDLADEFGVARSSINRIKRRRNWRHLL